MTAAPLAAQEPPPTAHYGDLPAVEDGVISANGSQIALLTTVGGDRFIRILARDGTPVTQLALGDAKVRSIEWIGDEAILVLRSETDLTRGRYGIDKYEWQRANVFPLDPRREPVSVFADQSYMVNAVLGYAGTRRVDGRWVGYFVGVKKGRTSGDLDRFIDGSLGLYEVDLLTGDVEQKTTAYEGSRSFGWAIDDGGEVRASYLADTALGGWKIENPDGKRIVSGRQEEGYVRLVGLDAQGTGAIYEIDDRDGAPVRRYAVPLVGGEPAALWPDLSIDRYIFAPNSARVLGVFDTDGTLHMADRAAQARLETASDGFGGKLTDIEDWSPDFATLLVRTSGNYDSGTWYRIDADGQRALVGLERPTIQGRAIGKVSRFAYTAGDGLAMEGILTLPPGREPLGLPAVILPHGGPTAHDEPGFDWWAQAFAAKGYAVLQPNFRGSTGYGAAFRKAGDGEWGRAMQTDLSDGLAALAQEGIADANRACIVGASYGGYAALAGVTLQQGVYRCAVAVNAIGDLHRFIREERRGLGAVFQRNLDMLTGDGDLKPFSPSRVAERADAPVLLIHGRDDIVVPYAQAKIMEDALEDAGKSVRLVTLAGEDHWLSQAETRKRMLAEAVAFVERHNPAD